MFMPPPSLYRVVHSAEVVDWREGETYGKPVPMEFESQAISEAEADAKVAEMASSGTPARKERVKP